MTRPAGAGPGSPAARRGHHPSRSVPGWQWRMALSLAAAVWAVVGFAAVSGWRSGDPATGSPGNPGAFSAPTSGPEARPQSLVATMPEVRHGLRAGLVAAGPGTTISLIPATSRQIVAGGGWRRDFFDDFTGALSPTWGRYGYGRQAPGQGAMGLYGLSNVFTSAGNLVLRTHYANGAWSSAGVSSGNGFAAHQGRWEVRARFEKATGIGYAFLLYPKGGSWPPELDLAEGRVNGPSVMSTLHWGPTNQQRHNFNRVVDMTVWHTYGVIMAANSITYTIDSQGWASFTSSNLPITNMWIGLQTGAMSCPSSYECVAGNVPSALTPATSSIYVDWVAHYAAA